MVPVIAPNIDGSQIGMTNGDLTLFFYRQYGGAPLRWLNHDVVDLIATFAGQGVNGIFETGNDGTQASADGITENPVARLFDGPTAHYSYYLAETAIASVTSHRDWVQYETQGHYPFFWASLDAQDDSIPPDSRGPSAWNTGYNNFLGLPIPVLTGPGVPLIFSPRGPVTSGIILIGDDILKFYNPSVRWNDAFTKIINGNFAFRGRITLAAAGADAIAGVVIRKSVPAGATADLFALYNSPTYQLNVNKAGVVQLVKDNVTVLWTAPSTYAADVNGPLGLKIELRTDQANKDVIDIYLQDSHVASVGGLTYAYPAFGFFAQTTSGQIYFTYREFFDMNVSVLSSWRMTDTLVESIYSLTASPATKFYRMNFPVMFVNQNIQETWELTTKDNGVYHMGESVPGQISAGLFPGSLVKSVWVGRKNYSAGIGIRCACPFDSGHALLSPQNVTFNPLPYDYNFSPQVVPNATLSLMYKGTKF